MLTCSVSEGRVFYCWTLNQNKKKQDIKNRCFAYHRLTPSSSLPLLFSLLLTLSSQDGGDEESGKLRIQKKVAHNVFRFAIFVVIMSVPFLFNFVHCLNSTVSQAQALQISVWRSTLFLENVFFFSLSSLSSGADTSQCRSSLSPNAAILRISFIFALTGGDNEFVAAAVVGIFYHCISHWGSSVRTCARHHRLKWIMMGCCRWATVRPNGGEWNTLICSHKVYIRMQTADGRVNTKFQRLFIYFSFLLLLRFYLVFSCLSAGERVLGQPPAPEPMLNRLAAVYDIAIVVPSLR